MDFLLAILALPFVLVFMPTMVTDILVASVVVAVKLFFMLYCVIVAAVIVTLLLMRWLRRPPKESPVKASSAASATKENHAAVAESVPANPTADLSAVEAQAIPGVNILTADKIECNDLKDRVQLDADAVRLEPHLKLSGDKIVLMLGEGGRIEKVIAEGHASIARDEAKSDGKIEPKVTALWNEDFISRRFGHGCILVKFGDNNQAESIHGLGNVMIIQDDKRARAAKAEYDVLAGKVTLSGGSPMALTGDGSIMTADTMHFWRNTGLFKGDKARIVPAGELDVPGLFPEPGR